MTVAGALSVGAAAHERGAGLALCIVVGVAGLVIGFGTGIVSSRFAYHVLGSRNFPDGLKLLIYMLIPIVSLMLVILTPFLFAMLI